MEILLDVRFRYTNPYKKDLIIPEHAFSFFMNNQEITSLGAEAGSFTIPAESSIQRKYRLSIDSDNQSVASYFGKDNVYRFESKFVIDLKDFIKKPDVLDNPFVDALGGTKRELHLEYSDTLRLPLPPGISPAMNATPGVRFLGEMETIDISPIVTGMTLFMDALFNTEISVYNPKPNDIFNTDQINAATHLVNSLAIIDPTIPVHYSNFQTQWTNLKEYPVITYPGPNVTGLEFTIPMVISNPNEFDIEVPQFASSAFVNAAYSPVGVHLKPNQASNTIAAGESKQIELSWQLDWNQQLLNFFQPNGFELQPVIRGFIQFDLGYGVVKVPYNFTTPLQFGN
jgi:hypothetical protein